MRLLRHLAGGRRALTATVAAIGLACGLGVGVPAAHAGTTCTWAPITLASGWYSEQGTYQTGDPSFCVEDDGMVYLSGSVAASVRMRATDTVGYLPSEAWPAHMLYLDVYTYSGTYGVLRIDTSGVIEAYGAGGTKDYTKDYTSLAGVSFPSASVAQSPISLENGWQSAQGKYGNTGDPAVSISNGVVHLSGSLWRPAGTPTSVPDQAAGDLTSEPLWPAEHCFFPTVYTYDGDRSTLVVNDGSGPVNWMYPLGTLFATNGQYTSLAGVSYLSIDVTSSEVTFAQELPQLAGNNYTSHCGGATVATIGDVVYLGGATILPPGFVGEFTVLPPAVRPAHNLYMIASYGVPVRIAPDGAVSVTQPLGALPGVVGLAGLSFPLGS